MLENISSMKITYKISKKNLPVLNDYISEFICSFMYNSIIQSKTDSQCSLGNSLSYNESTQQLMEKIEKMQMKAVPNKDNMPRIFSFVVMDATMFLSTSILDIMKWKARMAKHQVRQRVPNELPTMNKSIPENSVSQMARQYRFFNPGILNKYFQRKESSLFSFSLYFYNWYFPNANFM